MSDYEMFKISTLSAAINLMQNTSYERMCILIETNLNAAKTHKNSV